MKRVPTKRVRIEGKLWRIKLKRPPGRKTVAGLCDKGERIIYLHPKDISKRGIELACHEILHARLFDIDEEAVEEIGRLTAEACSWLLKKNGGKIV